MLSVPADARAVVADACLSWRYACSRTRPYVQVRPQELSSTQMVVLYRELCRLEENSTGDPLSESEDVAPSSVTAQVVALNTVIDPAVAA
jgi:hypothetical protein